MIMDVISLFKMKSQLMDTTIDYWFAIPNVVAVHANSKATGLGQLIKEYGNGIPKVLDLI